MTSSPTRFFLYFLLIVNNNVSSANFKHFQRQIEIHALIHNESKTAEQTSAGGHQCLKTKTEKRGGIFIPFKYAANYSMSVHTFVGWIH